MDGFRIEVETKSYEFIIGNSYPTDEWDGKLLLDCLKKKTSIACSTLDKFPNPTWDVHLGVLQGGNNLLSIALVKILEHYPEDGMLVVELTRKHHDREYIAIVVLEYEDTLITL